MRDGDDYDSELHDKNEFYSCGEQGLEVHGSVEPPNVQDVLWLIDLVRSHEPKEGLKEQHGQTLKRLMPSLYLLAQKSGQPYPVFSNLTN